MRPIIGGFAIQSVHFRPICYRLTHKNFPNSFRFVRHFMIANYEMANAMRKAKC